MLFRSFYLVICLFTAIYSLNLVAEPVSLPDLGDASSSTVTPENERQMGESLMRWLRQNELIVTDPLVQSYIHSLGYRLVANSDETRQPYTFFVVNDPSINAFAAPGGFIGVHTGLILTTQSESELAGVMAHEIAHITQKHMSRTIASASKQRLTTAVALLAAVLIGQNVPQLTEAAIATTLAANAQLQINFTRAHEKEADYIGIKTLANAGFDPNGMPAFFERMQKATRFYGNELPEFLRTHPVSVSRIADSRNRARNIHVKTIKPNKLYPYIKARLKVLKAKDIAQFIYDNKTEKSKIKDRDLYHYTMAIAYLKNSQAKLAYKHIQPLVKKNPESILYRISEAEIQQAMGKDKTALKNFNSILQLYPYSYAITVHYARHLLSTKHEQAAYSLLQDYARNRNVDATILKLLSEASSKTGKTAEAYLYLAEHDFLYGDTRAAISHLTTASKLKNIDYYLSSKIEAKLKSYKQIALLEK